VTTGGTHLTIGGGVTTGGGATGGSSASAGSTTAAPTLALTVNLTASEIGILTNAAAQLDAQQPEVVQVAAPEAVAWVVPAAPWVTASMRFQMRLHLSTAGRLRSGAAIVATPRFQQALAEWLDPAYLMAGVNIPPDTAGLLEVNAPFVEALMVGANH